MSSSSVSNYYPTKKIIGIDKPSFVRRWLTEFLIERHSFLSRAFCFLLAFAFFTFGPDLVWLFTSFLPIGELGSSGASIASHTMLHGIAVVPTAAILYFALRPNPSALILGPDGISIQWRVGLIKKLGTILPWNEIGTICIERPKDNTDLRTFKLCLYSSEGKNKSIKIPLGNIQYDEEKKVLVDELQTKALSANIEPGTLETIAPAGQLSFTDIWLDALSAAPDIERLTPLETGAVLKERFKIIKRLGGGGQANAFLASDSENTSAIVLKETILPVYADLHTRKQALEKFHEEALALVKIDHPQIVKYLDSFVEDHRAYLVLEFIEGKTLRKLVEENGALSRPVAIDYALQMCEMLSSLHGLNPALIHRDFTPDNMMVNSQNKLVLIDFAVAVNSSAESSSESAGKIAYMAPEQFKGISTIQSDIYSCAASIYYVLTARDPVALTEAHPATANEMVDKELDEIVALATKQSCDERYKTITELQAALLELRRKTIGD